jgi:hypothetical protein
MLAHEIIRSGASMIIIDTKVISPQTITKLTIMRDYEFAKCMSLEVIIKW